MRGVPRLRVAISSRASGARSSPSKSPRPAPAPASSSAVVVELQVRGEPEPIAQRIRQQAGPGGRADEGEGRRDRAGCWWPRALADHDVDAEVLHREVQHLFGGSRHAVDLVDEQHLARYEARQERRQVAGVLDGGPLDMRSGRRPRARRSSRASSCRGRAGRPAGCGRACATASRPRRAAAATARAPSPGPRTRRACAAGSAPSNASSASIVRRPDRRSARSSAGLAPAAGRARERQPQEQRALLASVPPSPSSIEAVLVPPTRGALRPAEADRARPTSLGRDDGGAAWPGPVAPSDELARRADTVMSFAVFGPIPDTLRNGASSSAATARAIIRRESERARPARTWGPTPETLRSRSKSSSSSREAKP